MSFQEEVIPIIEDLYYPSESDEPFEHISIQTEEPLPFSAETIRNILDETTTAPIEALDLDAFWEKLIVPKTWYGDDELLRVKQFLMLKTAIETHLTALQGFRIGEVEIEIYLIGITSEGTIEGIKTLSIET